MDPLIIRKTKIPGHTVPFELRKVISNGLREWPDMSKQCRWYVNELVEIKKSDRWELNSSNYVKSLKLALHVEELRIERDLQRYDMTNRNIARSKSAEMSGYEIHVEGLVDEGPLISVKSTVQVTDATTKEQYLLVVKKILSKSLFVIPDKNSKRFDKDFKPYKRYDIKFILNAYPYDCCHFALDLLPRFKLLQHLFPTKTSTNRILPVPTNLWFNKMISKNPEQCEAVVNMLNKSSAGLPYILYGPPGTGKTTTIIEAICQAWKSKYCKRILVCTPSNETADYITKRLFQYIPKRELHRMYSLAKDVDTIDIDILHCSNCVGNIITIFPPKDLPKIVISTLCTSTRLLLLKMNINFFSYVFIDEAGQATEPDTIIPLTILSSSLREYTGRFHGQVVLAGDPQQLGPVIFSDIAKKILGRSMLERLLEFAPYKKNCNKYNQNYITKLVRNYRSHPSLIQVSNSLFYEDELIACANENVQYAEGWEELPNKNLPMLFREVRGNEAKDRGPSSYNEAELQIVCNYVHKLIGTQLGNKKIEQKDIGIVTPFIAQKLKILEQLKDDDLEEVDVGTVQLFQGKEKEVIILSMVRTEVFHDDKGSSHIGFLSDPKRFNVALTRAKSLQIVVGDPCALEVDKNWKYLITYCRDNNAYSNNNFLPVISVQYETRRKTQTMHSFNQFTWRIKKKEMKNNSHKLEKKNYSKSENVSSSSGLDLQMFKALNFEETENKKWSFEEASAFSYSAVCKTDKKIQPSPSSNSKTSKSKRKTLYFCQSF